MASLLTEHPLVLLGDQYQRFEQVITILGEILDKKYIEVETGAKLANFVKNIANDANLGPHFKTIFDNKLSQDAKARFEKALTFAQWKLPQSY